MFNRTAEIEALYEEAHSLVQQELALLDKEDIDALSDMTLKRETLITKMLAIRHECDEDWFLELLIKLQVAQQELILKARKEQDYLRGHLQVRKKQSGYFTNAQKQVAHADKAFYMNKVS